GASFLPSSAHLSRLHYHTAKDSPLQYPACFQTTIPAAASEKTVFPPAPPVSAIPEHPGRDHTPDLQSQRSLTGPAAGSGSSSTGRSQSPFPHCRNTVRL